MASTPAVRVILGTMTFGARADEMESRKMLQTFYDPFTQRTELDTAFLYNDGATDKILGGNKKLVDKYTVATKVNPWHKLGLSREGIVEQFTKSLKRMNRETVDILYLHAPDTKNSIETSLETVNDLHKQGRFRELGLSNYSAAQVRDIHALCVARGWVRPTVYQGMYNLLARLVEGELLPTLRSLGIRFYAFNPLAGGLLTNKHKASSNGKGTRFDEGKSLGKMYRERYWKDSFFAAVAQCAAAAEASGLAVSDVALRWLLHHSQLSGKHGDAVILGCSSEGQLSMNLKATGTGPLPGCFLNADGGGMRLDALWEEVSKDAPAYHR